MDEGPEANLSELRVHDGDEERSREKEIADEDDPIQTVRNLCRRTATPACRNRAIVSQTSHFAIQCTSKRLRYPCGWDSNCSSWERGQ